jgi:hypothetical protein
MLVSLCQKVRGLIASLTETCIVATSKYLNKITYAALSYTSTEYASKCTFKMESLLTHESFHIKTFNNDNFKLG